MSGSIGITVAQGSDDKLIPWTKEFQIGLEHIQENSDSDTIEFGSTLQPRYELRYSNQVDSYEIINIRISAMFDPTIATFSRESWPVSENEKLLKFFQGAFDLTEEFARMAQTTVEDIFFRKSFPCKGRSKFEKKRLAQPNARQKIFNALKPVIAKMGSHNHVYLGKVGTPKQFDKHFKEYVDRFDELRKDVS